MTAPRPATTLALLGCTLVLIPACFDRADPEEVLEAARERSRAVAAADWSYQFDTLPPEPGGSGPRIVDRCLVTLPEAGAPTDVACGEIFLGLEPDADSAWIARVVESLGAEVVDRGRIPGWTSALGEPQPYMLLRVEPRTEGRTIQRAFHSDGIRFVDIRPVRRRRP